MSSDKCDKFLASERLYHCYQSEVCQSSLILEFLNVLEGAMKAVLFHLKIFCLQLCRYFAMRGNTIFPSYADASIHGRDVV